MCSKLPDRRYLYLLLIIAGLMSTACGDQMRPAQRSLDEATNALRIVGSDGNKYMPYEFEALQSRLRELRSAFQSKNYSAVLTEAPALRLDAMRLTLTVVNRKAQARRALTTQWTTLSTSIPKLIEGVERDMNAQSKVPHLSQDSVSTARSALNEAAGLWAKAGASYKTGNLEQAVDTAEEIMPNIDIATNVIGKRLPLAP